MIDSVIISPDWVLRRSHAFGVRTGPVQFKVSQASRRMVWVKVNLPRLLFGTNVRLLSSQHELDTALRRLRECLDRVAFVPKLDAWPCPKRLDLVSQWGARHTFGLPVETLLTAHSGLPFPGIAEPGVRRRNSVSWMGHELAVIIYGKSHKHRISGDLLRAEVRLSKLCLRSQLDHRNWRDFSDLWEIFRELLSKMPTIQRPKLGGGFPEAIGRAVPTYLHEAILAELGHRRLRTLRAYRRRIAIAAANLPSQFDWADYLPERFSHSEHRSAPRCLVQRSRSE